MSARWPTLSIAGWVVAATAIALAPVGFFAPVAATPFLIAGGGVLCLSALRSRRLPRAGATAIVLVALFLAWAAFSAVWAVESGLALNKTLALAAVALLAWLWLDAGTGLDDHAGDAIGCFLAIGVGIAIVLFLIEAATGAVIHRIIFYQRHGATVAMPLEILNRPLTLLVLLFWPALLWLTARQQRALAVLFLVGTVVALAASRAGSVRLALLSGSVAAALAFVSPRRAGTAIGAIAAALVLAAPLLVLHGEASTRVPGLFPLLPQSALHRLEMWEFVAGRIEERPLLGYGLDGSRVLPGAAEPYRLGGGQVMGLHPHNAPLQVWLELGLPGAALAALGLLVAFHRIGAAARSRSSAAAGIGAGVTALTVASLSFGIWQTWWLASLVLAAALTAVVARGVNPPPQPVR